VDTSSNNSNCGGCGKACASGTHCSTSQCVCDNSDTSCGTGGACTNCTQTGGKTCQSAMCQCPSTKPLICNNTCTASDSSNCGSCGNSCGAGGSCVSNSCHCRQQSSTNKWTNAGFDTSNQLNGWAIYGGPVLTQWSSDDADGCPNSGSALLTGADILYQCIPATSGLLYAVGVRYKGDAPSFNVLFVSDCSSSSPYGPALDEQTVTLSASSNWTPYGTSFTAPAGTSGLFIVFYAGGGTASYDQPYVMNGSSGSF
jgi:hypothetical protein